MAFMTDRQAPITWSSILGGCQVRILGEVLVGEGEPLWLVLWDGRDGSRCGDRWSAVVGREGRGGDRREGGSREGREGGGERNLWLLEGL